MPLTTFVQRLGSKWTWFLFRGIVAILFGIAALAMPGLTLATLTLLWGAYALVEGVVSLVTAFQARDTGLPLWPLILGGIAGIGAGIVTFVWPGLTVLTLLTLIACWAVVMGIFQIIAAIRLRREIQGEWWLVLSGVLSVLFGVAMFARPGAGALAVISLIAGFSIVFGVMLIAVSLRIRKLKSFGT